MNKCRTLLPLLRDSLFIALIIWVKERYGTHQDHTGSRLVRRVCQKTKDIPISLFASQRHQLRRSRCSTLRFLFLYLIRKSWPRECQDGDGPSEANLRYCGQTWVDQIIHFIEEVIFTRERSDGDGLLNRKVHIMGNSVGGHLAVFLAVQRPEYVESLALLNATPVWGLNLPGWNGRLPAPWLPKVVGRYLFDRIRDLQTIETYLEAAYFNRAAFDNSLIQQIRDSTEITNGGHAAFASILWSPPIDFDRNSNKQQTFYQALSTLDGDVLMLFGRDDPWCKPAFARRMLEQVPRHVASRYVEMANVGHCPNHEAPIATAFVLRKWWQASHEQRKSDDSFITNVIIKERWGQTELQERKSQDIELSLLDQIAVAFV